MAGFPTYAASEAESMTFVTASDCCVMFVSGMGDIYGSTTKLQGELSASLSHEVNESLDSGSYTKYKIPSLLGGC